MGTVPALSDESEVQLGPRLLRIGAVDAVGLEAHADDLARRSIEREARLWALELAVRVLDLATPDGTEAPGEVRALCSKALRPDPADPSVPPAAAVCVYPDLVPAAKERLQSTVVRVASAATPSGRLPTNLKVAEARRAVELGADEVEMAIDRGAFLAGRYARVFDEIVQVKEATGGALLKVILGTGELGTYDNVRRASLLAMVAGADFVEPSSDEVSPAATLPTALCILQAIRDVHDATGRVVGFKPAGGVCAAKQAIQHLVLVHETLGREWLRSDRFRIGASTLLDDLLLQIRAQKTGIDRGEDVFTLD